MKTVNWSIATLPDDNLKLLSFLIDDLNACLLEIEPGNVMPTREFTVDPGSGRTLFYHAWFGDLKSDAPDISKCLDISVSGIRRSGKRESLGLGQIYASESFQNSYPNEWAAARQWIEKTFVKKTLFHKSIMRPGHVKRSTVRVGPEAAIWSQVPGRTIDESLDKPKGKTK